MSDDVLSLLYPKSFVEHRIPLTSSSRIKNPFCATSARANPFLGQLPLSSRNPKRDFSTPSSHLLLGISTPPLQPPRLPIGDSPNPRLSMSSQAWVAQEVEVPAPSAPSAQSQVSESITGEEQVSPTSTPASTPISSAGGSDSNVAAPIDPPTMDSGSATVVTVSPPKSSPARRATHGTASDSLQDPVRAKFVTSPGYVVPAPSFSYSVFPRVNSASGIPQQTSSAPALKLTPPMSPAALQPPVPRQPLGNRPSFSYNIVPQPNASPASGQQFQLATATNQRQLLFGNPAAPPLSATCLQPPVPRQPIRLIASSSVTVPHNFPPPMQLPLLPPKGQLSPSTNFSFGGGSQSTTLEASVQNLPSNNRSSDTASLDTSTTSASTSSDSKLSQDMPTSSSVGLTVPSISNSSSVLQPTGHLVTARAPMFGSPTVDNLPRASDSSALHLATPTSSLATIRPTLHNQAPAPLNHSSTSNPPPQNVPHKIYAQFASVPAMTLPPQAHWLHPPQASGLQHPPFSQYPAVLPHPFPFPAKGMPPPSVHSPDVRPPVVSPEVTCEEVPTSKMESCFPEINAGAGSLPPDDVKKEANVLQEGGDGKSDGWEAWTVHRTETGVLYYYNIISGESTYERPSNFKGEPEKTEVKIIPVSWEKLPGTNWTLVTTNDGKKYYYNTLNKVSSWQVPAEVLEMKKNHEINPTKEENTSIPADKGTTSSSLSAPALHNGGRDSMTLKAPSGQVSASALDLIKKKLQDSVTSTVSTPLQTSGTPTASDLNGSRVDTSAKGQQPADSKDRVKDANGDGNISDSSSDSDDVESGPTKEECIIQFKEMLKERGVAPFSKWDKELPKFVFDPRFKAVPSYSARRAIFEQYVRTRAEEERKEKKAAQKAGISGFKQLLEEASEDIDIKTDFQTFKRKWGSDPRFVALDRKERESLFNEKVIPLRKAAEEKVHAEREVAVSGFKSMLKEKRDITTSSRWSKVKDNLRNDSRYKTVNHEDREASFNSYIAELKAVEHEAERAAKAKKDEHDKLKEREREMRKRKEREEQEMERIRLKVRRKEIITSYQALLVEIIKDPKASWTESKPRLERDPQGRATNPDLNHGDAEKLFRDHVKDLNERCARDFRAMLAEILTSDAAARSTEDEKNIFNSWSEVKRVLKPDPRFSKMPRKDREALWLRYVQDMMRRKKVVADTKDKLDTEGKNRSPADTLTRSPRRSHGRR